MVNGKRRPLQAAFGLGLVVDGHLLAIDLWLLFRPLFLALEVDVREGVDDLDDAWGEAVAAAFDAHYDARAG
ncbi:MAG: hypothetical protein KA810_13790, partial [Pyrinomonadaceae bacterium]|nr:hypothetical protein [Pyrinomonadaceae bacterium]